MAFYILISRQLLQHRLTRPRVRLGVRHTKSTRSTLRAPHFQRCARGAYISDFFFYLPEKGKSNRNLLLPKDRFYRLPVVSYQAHLIRTQSVRLFRTHTDKVCLIC